MNWVRHFRIIAITLGLLMLTGCFRYSFTGTSIPSDVHSIYLPFFADKSSSGIGDLGDMLNRALINRFVNQSRLRLSNTDQNADIILKGVITSYNNGPFSISGNQKASLNRVTISVNATFKYQKDQKPKWDKTFTGFGDYDPNKDPISGEKNAAKDAMDQISRKMFDESIGKW
ncbi:MAG TPA: LptE family protein [Balneolales bacterium]|nr:LptE family protein [Balneolales bacterium]